jgi:hypothetical protein
VKLDPKTLLSSEPVRAIMTAVAGAIGLALYAILPEGPIKLVALGVAGSIAGAGEVARTKTLPEAKAAQLATTAAAQAGAKAAEQITPELAGRRNEVPPPTEDLVRNVALDAAKDALVSVGVAAGKNATAKATSLVEGAVTSLAESITGRVGRILHRK